MPAQQLDHVAVKSSRLVQTGHAKYTYGSCLMARARRAARKTASHLVLKHSISRAVTWPKGISSACAPSSCSRALATCGAAARSSHPKIQTPHYSATLGTMPGRVPGGSYCQSTT
jgi:hypothetical protein